MLRCLSSFLADTSLASDGDGALEEALQLVAEHARELLGAEWALANIAFEGEPGVVAAAPVPPPGVTPATLLELASANAPAFAALAALLGSDGPFRDRLAAPLKALDGRQLGSIQLLGKRDGGFSDADDAILTHLAETASAAIERRWLYERVRRGG
jgi:GAF domain-containing protein